MYNLIYGQCADAFSSLRLVTKFYIYTPRAHSPPIWFIVAGGEISLCWRQEQWKRERLLLQRFPIKNFVICLRVYAPQWRRFCRAVPVCRLSICSRRRLFVAVWIIFHANVTLSAHLNTFNETDAERQLIFPLWLFLLVTPNFWIFMYGRGKSFYWCQI